jgi:hypothetical protein
VARTGAIVQVQVGFCGVIAVFDLLFASTSLFGKALVTEQGWEVQVG